MVESKESEGRKSAGQKNLANQTTEKEEVLAKSSSLERNRLASRETGDKRLTVGTERSENERVLVQSNEGDRLPSRGGAGRINKSSKSTASDERKSRQIVDEFPMGFMENNDI